MGGYLEEIQVQVFGRKWKPLKRPEAIDFGCSGRFVDHCKLQARSYFGKYFLRLGCKGEIFQHRIQNHGRDVEVIVRATTKMNNI